MPVVAPGSDWDIHKCITSAGYTFCEVLGRCIRLWEEKCSIPPNCLTWNDGCNTCSVSDGNLELCTEMYCLTQGTPNCMVYAPSPTVYAPSPTVYAPDVIVDPMPPVINPFLGGH